jgi:alpha-tubulin suppressor-like RCC1 family protein
VGWAASGKWLWLAALGIVAAALVALPAAALGAQGDFYSVGDNREGELGSSADNAHEVAHPTPFTVPLAAATGAVVQISAGAHSSFALTSTGQLYGFGENYYGQLGSSTNNLKAIEEFPYPNPTPSPISLPGATGPVTAVAGGRFHTLALTSTGQLYAFGDNAYGQLGIQANSGTNNANPTPSLVSLPGATGPPAQIAAGEDASLVVTSTGQLYAFGNNFYGQIGRSANSGTKAPNPKAALVTLPGAGGPVVQASVGRAQSLAVTSTGQLYSFGSNSDGQLGVSTNFGTSNPNPVPEPVSLPGATGPVVEASAGYDHSLALTATGQVYAFGENLYGQLGISTFAGTSTDIPVPQQVSLPGASGAVVAVIAATYDGYALTSSGQLFGFGSNRWGQLASATNNGNAKPNLPRLMSSAGNPQVDAVAAGDEHALVLTADLSVSTGALAGGVVGSPYSATVASAGGTAPQRWSASGLPPGLAIDAVGEISGTPTAAGSFNPTVTVTDRYGIAASRTLGLSIAAAGPQQQAVAPRLAALKATRRSLSLDGRLVDGQCVAPTASNRDQPSCRQKLKLTLALTLDAAAKLTVEIDRLRAGRLRRGRCLAPTDANRGLPSCTRSTSVGKPIVKRAKAGAGTLSIVGPRLLPGRYRLTATPSAHGRRGRSKTTSIRITG